MYDAKILFGIDPWERKCFSKHDVKDDNDWNELLNDIAKIQDLSNFKVTFLKGTVCNKLHTFPNGYFDAIYIDGDHTINSVIIDFAYSWGKLKTGGVMIFDDYLMRGNRAVKIAVDTILLGLGKRCELLFSNRQLGIKKM